VLPEILTLDRFDLPTKPLNIFSFAKLVLLRITLIDDRDTRDTGKREWPKRLS
jgi:hypothetical protein